MSVIPYDIFTEIAQLIRRGNELEDFRTLYAMSQTSRTMLLICRQQLFREIALAPQTWDSLSPDVYRQNLASTSISKPEVLFRIKSIKLLVDSSPDVLKNVRTLHIYSHQSNHNDATLDALLPQFEDLQSLTIEPSDAFEITPWNSLAPTYRSSLLQLIHRSPLRNLSVGGYEDIPLDILLPLRSLVSLSLNTTTFSSEISTVSLSISHASLAPLQIKDLKITGVVHKNMGLLEQDAGQEHPIIDPSALRSLSIQPADYGQQWDVNALKKMTNLEYLAILKGSLSMTNVTIEIVHNIHPHSLTSLLSFHYSIKYHVFSRFNEYKFMPTAVICDLTFHRLETLAIHLGITFDSQEHVLQDLQKLDAMIVDSPNLPSLKNLVLEIQLLWKQISNIDEWRSVPTTHFPRISSSSNIRLTYSCIRDIDI
ncbi:hypothetical protein BDN70DRAFT_995916 [Pholiota conissans]|uniref:Uncharacterized protein n=1 Tax=Pholiota conissans TaxID=109636 RepID=A0A9P5YY48_9AGAR|nr:hypothetical protein BDN70DRAFT_995916 [Pholiota conissans]